MFFIFQQVFMKMKNWSLGSSFVRKTTRFFWFWVCECFLWLCIIYSILELKYWSLDVQYVCRNLQTRDGLVPRSHSQNILTTALCSYKVILNGIFTLREVCRGLWLRVASHTVWATRNRNVVHHLQWSSFSAKRASNGAGNKLKFHYLVTFSGIWERELCSGTSGRP